MKSKAELIKMMQLTKLSVESEDVDSIYHDIQDIFAVIKMIDDVDISKYDCEDEPVYAVTREDELAASYPIELILSNAAESSDGFFTVKNSQ